MMGRGNSATMKSIGSWVEKTCTPVPDKDYGGSASSASPASGSAKSGSNSPGASARAAPRGIGGTGGETLCECKS